METKLITIFSLTLVVLSIMLPSLVFGEAETPLFEDSRLPIEFSIPGRTEGGGTYFEIKDNEYLNITLKSTKEIKVVLESIPKMISLNIETASDSMDFTELTIEGLEPNKIYYKYQDSYKNEAVFVSSENGSYSWIQDLPQPHHVWIQEEKGTTFIDKDTVLDHDITGSVEITADNIILNCNGYSIIGSGTGYGIYLNSKKGVTIKNCNVTEFSYGIFLKYSSGNNIAKNSVHSNNYQGIYFFQSWNNNVTENMVYSNDYDGIYMSGGDSRDNNIIGNEISDNGWRGICLSGGNNYLRDNSLRNNKYNFDVSIGSVSYLPSYIQDIDTSNTVNGKPIYYLINEKDKIIDFSWNAGYLGIVNSTNITVRNIDITNNGEGILFAYTDDSRIENVNVSGNLCGISLNHAQNNVITYNNVSDNSGVGILLRDFSNNNIISENNVLNNGDGISLVCVGCTVSGNIVSGNYDTGIGLYSSADNNVISNDVSNNGGAGTYNIGIYMAYSFDNNIAENIVSNNEWVGIYLEGWWDDPSTNNKINKNDVFDNKYGIFLAYYSPRNYFRENSMRNNKYNFGIREWFVDSPRDRYIQDIDISNTVNGKPIYYLVNEQNRTIDAISNAGFVGTVNSENMMIKDLTLENNYEGILLVNTTSSRVENVNVLNNAKGISLYFSSGIEIIRNNISNNEYGISLSYSSSDNITGNIISSNEGTGIFLFRSSNNNITKNNILDNKSYGIYFSGVWFEGSNDNKVYHNNFINNYKKQVYIYEGTGNFFDNGYPSGGNYWSNYTGTNLYRGPNQDQPGSDRIGDTPYTFPWGGRDNYPFLKESDWEIPKGWSFDIAVILVETNDVTHESSSITAQPCKLLPEKTYPQGHNKEYYQDLVYCVADYHKENSFGRVNLKFTIYDNNGEWYKTDKNEGDYVADERNFVIDALNVATTEGIDLNSKDIIIVLHAGEAAKTREDLSTKLQTLTWSPSDQPFGSPPHKAIVAEDDLTGAWAHEVGHIIGALTTPENTMIPDLYKMGNVDEWDLMARGSWNENGNNPPYMSSYTKEFLGWLNYDIYPKSAYGEYWINSLDTSELDDDVFRYNLSDDASDESPKYYILEARNKNLKTWDSSLPEEKALVLYRVDAKGYSEYDYASDGVPNNQHRKIWIPGGGISFGDGVLTPDGDSHLDMLNLLYISALSDEIINNEEYKIKAKIEKIDYDFFKDRFRGVILEPSPQFYQKIIQYLPLSYTSLRFELYARQESLRTGAIVEWWSPEKAKKEKTEEVIALIAAFLVLSILLVSLFIITRKLKSISLRKGTGVILVIFWIILIFGFAVVMYLYFNDLPRLADFYEAFMGMLGWDAEEMPIPFYPAPLQERISIPDLDLHFYCNDGKHIGMNYQTGEYENQIPGAIVSGDNQDAPEWIFIPKDITNCHFVVSSYDNQKFLEENPEIAQQIEDTTDSYEVYARYIDPAAAIYTSAIISEEIEAGEELEQPIRGTADISVFPAILWITAPKQLKEEVIQELEQAKTGEKIIDREIDLVIRYLNRSLDDKLWLDASHLDPKDGQEVFHREHMAVVHMYYKIKIFEKEISTLNKVIENKQKRGLDTDREESKLRAINIILPVFEQAIDDLVKADEILAEIILNEAKNTEVKDPKFQKIVIHQIEKAEREFTMAYEELEEDKPTEAIIRFGLVWRYSQLAIKFALNK